MSRLMLAAFAMLIKGSGALWWAKRKLRQEGAIVVLMFHRVLSQQEKEKASSMEGIEIGKDNFEQLSAYLVRHYQTVDAGTAIPGGAAERLRVTYTFDDGWRDNYSNALPVLKKYAIPATVFLCPGLMGENLPFWPERIINLLRRNPAKPSLEEIETTVEKWKHQPAEDRLAFMEQLERQAGGNAQTGNDDQLCNWQEAEALRKAGVRLGSHTQMHELLPMIPASHADRELRQSKAAIENATGSCTLFAYPNGDWNAETRQLVAEAGFDRAFTTETGAWRRGCDPLAIPRVNISDDNIRGATGKFSPRIFEYWVFWRAWRATTNGSQRDPGTDAGHAEATDAMTKITGEGTR